MWKQGAIGVKDSNGRMVSITYWVKHYEEPSEEYGISGGRISKLMLKQDGRSFTTTTGARTLKPRLPKPKRRLQY